MTRGQGEEKGEEGERDCARERGPGRRASPPPAPHAPGASKQLRPRPKSLDVNAVSGSLDVLHDRGGTQAVCRNAAMNPEAEVQCPGFGATPARPRSCARASRVQCADCSARHDARSPSWQPLPGCCMSSTGRVGNNCVALDSPAPSPTQLMCVAPLETAPSQVAVHRKLCFVVSAVAPRVPLGCARSRNRRPRRC